MIEPVLTESTLARYWSKVTKLGPEDCWPWTGGVNGPDGRGCLWVNERMQTAPRIALWSAGISAPEGKTYACHTCDNPPCCNPAHLWWGDNTDNLRDASSKKRLQHQTDTHCIRGHPFDEKNTRVRPGGQRQCKQCQKIHKADHKARSASAA